MGKKVHIFKGPIEPNRVHIIYIFMRLNNSYQIFLTSDKKIWLCTFEFKFLEQSDSFSATNNQKIATKPSLNLKS